MRHFSDLLLALNLRKNFTSADKSIDKTTEFENSPVKSNLRVFLSYGHDEYVKVAQQVKKDLEIQGFKVWFDADKLHVGVDWQAYIEEGLKWAAEDSGGKFLLLMTPHSVRRPKGFCLNELARAIDYNMMIYPIMIVTVEPPVTISRLQYLDWRDIVPLNNTKKRYRHKFRELKKYLEGKIIIEFEGSFSRLRNALNPLQFSGDINWHLPRFTGRQWLLNRIYDWLNNYESKQVYFITGQPGCGKTAISSFLINKLPEVAAFHLCRYGYSDKNDPARCIKSIAYQLSTQLTDYRERLLLLNLDTVHSQNNPYDLFDKLIIQPLCDNFPHPGRTIIILIDALDEATKDNKNDLASLIATEMPKTPQWLKLIVTSRPEHAVMTRLQGLHPHVIDITSDANLKDIREYLIRELAVYAPQGKPFEDVISQIIRKSEGLFLYIEKVREDVINGYLSLENIHEFPEGLGGCDHNMFERQFPPGKVDYNADIRPVLDVIAAYPEIDVRMLEALFEWSEHDRHDFLRKMGTLFDVSDNYLKPFHKSLLDWLIAPGKSGQYLISFREGFNIIKEKCDAVLSERKSGRDNYWLARLMREVTWLYDKDNILNNNVDYLLYAREVFKEYGEHSLYLQASCDIARAYRETGDPENARLIGEEGIKEAIKIDDISVRGNFYHILGGSYYDLGCFEQAMDNFEKALIDFEHLDKMGCTAVRRRMANVMVKQERYSEAVSLLKQVLKEYRYCFHSSLGVALTLSAIGNCYYEMGKKHTAKALPALLSAIEVIEKNRIAHTEANAERILNQVEKRMGKETFKKAFAAVDLKHGEYADYIII